MKKLLLFAALAVAAVCGGFSAQAQNAYAYGLKGSLAADYATDTVTYSLNAAATAVSIDIYNGSTLVKSVASDGLTVGAHSVVVPTSDLAKGATYTWKVKVTGAKVASGTFVKALGKFYAPYGVVADANPNSKYFGRIYVAESKYGSAVKYQSSKLANGNGTGLYVFDATGDSLMASNGKYGFTGGMTINNGKIGGSNVAAFDPKRLAISADGRLFISRLTNNVSPVYEVNTDNLNADFTPIFSGGTYVPKSFNMVDADGNFIAGPNVAMSVKGSGANLKLALISADSVALLYTQSGFRAAEYDLGTATSWTSVPSRFITGLDKKYSIAYDNTNIQYDINGGVWFFAARSAASATQPDVVHVKSDLTTEDFSVKSNTNSLSMSYPRNGGFCISADSNYVAFPMNSSRVIAVYKMDHSADSVKLTLQYSFQAKQSPSALAWDYADNLCAVSNRDEVFELYQLPHPNGIDYVITPAMEAYSISIPADVYLIGSIDEASNSTTWDATKGCKMTYDATSQKYSATVNMTKAGGTFGVSKVIAENNDAGGWTYVNASRFIPDADGLSLDYGVAKPMSPWESGKNYAWSFPILGKFKVVVDLNAMTIRDTLVTSVYPMNLYVIGNTNFSNTWSTSVPLAKMTETADGVYGGAFKLNEVSTDNQYQYFSVVKNLGADWDAVNVTGNRFGPTTDGTVLATDATVSSDFGNHNTAYKVPYTEGNTLWLTVDLTASTISAKSNTTGVAGVGAASVKVIAGVGQISIVGSAKSIEVYTAGGALISKNQVRVNCAPGFYVVRVDGVATKVLVK
jgi:hypothetical protein